MALQNAGLIRQSAGRAVLQSIPMPNVPDDYILVRTVAVGLNPTDWTTLDAKGDDGTLVGCQFSGVVEEVGKTVTKPFKKGDRVVGFGHGGNDANPQTGAFARYIIAKGDAQLKIPDSTSYEAAAAFGTEVTCAGFGLFKLLGLPYPKSQPPQDGRAILIYGGSTATGLMAIQLAKLCGLKVVTTCSPKNFELVKGAGADLVYDYRVPGVGKQINEATNNELSLGFDCVNSKETVAVCAEAFGSSGGKFVNLLDEPCPRPDVTSLFFLGYDVSGEEYIFEGEKFPANPEAFSFAAEWVPIAEKIWAEGKLKPHPQRIGAGGLGGVLDGLQIMREGKYSGEKLVYSVEESTWAF